MPPLSLFPWSSETTALDAVNSFERAAPHREALTFRPEFGPAMHHDVGLTFAKLVRVMRLRRHGWSDRPPRRALNKRRSSFSAFRLPRFFTEAITQHNPDFTSES